VEEEDGRPEEEEVLTSEEHEEEQLEDQRDSGEAVLDRVVDMVVDGADPAVKEFLLTLCTTGKTMANAQLRAIVSAFVRSAENQHHQL
jgi:hypothetical protein